MLTVEFDGQCATENNCHWLKFETVASDGSFTDREQIAKLILCSGGAGYPCWTKKLYFEGDSVWVGVRVLVFVELQC